MGAFNIADWREEGFRRAKETDSIAGAYYPSAAVVGGGRRPAAITQATGRFLTGLSGLA